MARSNNVYSYEKRKAHSSADRTDRRNPYIYGNAVPKQEILRQLEEEPKELSNHVRRNREKALRMNLGYVLFLAVAMFSAGFILLHYIQLKSDLTNMSEAVAAKERQLNDLKLDNDEALNRINSSIDMEEIKRIAIGELGMVYAKEGQIATYTAEGQDYLRKVSED